MAFILGAIYIVLLVTLGIMSIRKGHWVMFIIGLFSPPPLLADWGPDATQGGSSQLTEASLLTPTRRIGRLHPCGVWPATSWTETRRSYGRESGTKESKSTGVDWRRTASSRPVRPRTGSHGQGRFVSGAHRASQASSNQSPPRGPTRWQLLEGQSQGRVQELVPIR